MKLLKGSGVNVNSAKTFLTTILKVASQEFYNGGAVTFFDQDIVLLDVIKVEKSRKIDVKLYIITPKYLGIQITEGLLNLKNLNSVKFSIGHEVGHTCSQKVLQESGIIDYRDSLVEVVADLVAAYLMNCMGFKWDDIIELAENGVKDGIFDEQKRGTHPEGSLRVEYLQDLKELIEEGRNFYEAVMMISILL